MNQNVQNRLQSINLLSIILVVIYSMVVTKLITKSPIVNPYVDRGLVLLTSIGFYKLIILAIFTLIGQSDLFLRLYWGRYYVKGFWSYTYTLEKKGDNTVYFGVWRFEQTLYGTHVTGFGLNEKFTPRSRVSSATDIMLASTGEAEIINKRSDSVKPGLDYYSRTTMHFELNTARLFRIPIRMRGYTIMYGGPRNSVVCNNYFVRHMDAKTEEDVVQELKDNYQKYGSIHPPGSK